MTGPAGGDRSRRGRRLARDLAAGAVALLALGALLWAVGVERVHDVVGGLGPRDAAVLGVLGLVPVVVWGLELRVVLRGIGEPVGRLRAVELFAAAGFLNNVTPLGELGGDPPSGLLVAGDRHTSFERGLAAITGTNVLNRLAVVALGVAGASWLAAGGGPSLGWSVLLAVAAEIALVAGVVVAWLFRDRIIRGLLPAVATVVGRIGRWLPLVEAPSPSAVEARVRGFVAAIERLVGEPRRLVTALLLGLLGHLAAAATLLVALRVLGATVTLADLLVVIPLAKASGLSPTPGGAGSASVLLAGLLVTISGVDPATAAAGAVLYRAAAFWVPTAVGGAVAVRLVTGMAGGGAGDQDSRR